MLAGHASGCWLSELGAGMTYNREKNEIQRLKKTVKNYKNKNLFSSTPNKLDSILRHASTQRHGQPASTDI